MVRMTMADMEAMLDCLLAFTDPGDRVVLTNPTYSGMAQRTRLASAVFTPEETELIAALAAEQDAVLVSIFANEHEERLREAGALVAEFVRGLDR
jgi:aspartate/methionine/tyrosine aminotransferase